MPTLKLKNMVTKVDPTDANFLPKSDWILDDLGNPEIARDEQALAQQAVYCVRTRRREDSSFGSDIHSIRGQKVQSVAQPFGTFTVVAALAFLKRIQDRYLREHPEHPLTEVIQTVTNVAVNTRDKIRVDVKISAVSEIDQPISVEAGV